MPEDYKDMKLAELKERAEQAGIGGTADMNKADLVEALEGQDKGGGGGGGKGGGGNGGDEEGTSLNYGDDSSKTLKYAKEIRSVDEHEDHPGQTLATTVHDVIRQWAEERGGRPATVPGTEHEGRLGVLRFDFGDDDPGLEEVSWDDWFETFDARNLNFLYQEHLSSGDQSNFFRFDNPEREDA